TTEPSVAGKPDDAAHVLDGGMSLNHLGGARRRAMQVDGDFSFQAGPLPAVFGTTAAFREKERLVTTKKDAHAIRVLVQGAAAAKGVLEVVERNAVRPRVEDRELQVLKARRPRPFPDIIHDHVSLERRVVLHLVLR